LLRGLVLFLAGGLAAGAALGLLAGFLAPVHPLFDSFAHFRLHAAALSAAALILAIVRARRTALACLALAALGVVLLGPARPSLSLAAASARPADLRLMQFNMLFSNPRPEAVEALIRGARPDVVALQEVSSRLMPVVDRLADLYPVRHVCRAHSVGGVAVLSRLPLASLGEPGCASGRGLAWLRIETSSGPVTVASLHLHWPYPFGQSFNYPHFGTGCMSVAPSAMSMSRERPRHMTMLPGGGSRLRAR